VSAPAGLRRAGAADLTAVTTLQHAAYAANRALLGVEPLPLRADYAEVLAMQEVWLADGAHGLDGALILEVLPDALLVWSLATAPAAQGRGVGRQLLAAAEERAHFLGRPLVRLYTGEKLTGNIAWYRCHGYAVERVERLPDRAIVHMIKAIA
jgi:ribosomal protein S18 acetylase RimI-like enzyme